MLLAIRTDATVSIGTGHLMRCLSLASMVRRRGAQVVFLSRALPPGLEPLIVERGASVHVLEGPSAPSSAPFFVDVDGDARQVLDWARAHGPVDGLVVDHYGLDARWESTVRGAFGRVLVIDDLANRPHDADLLLDQNLWHSGASRYDPWVSASCRRFVGPQFALLRDEFSAARKRWPREPITRVEHVLVNFGGADPGDMTARALAALELAGPSGLAVDAVVGAAYPHLEALQERWGAAESVTIHVQSRRMGELMARAQLAIGAAGTTSWERCYLGLPGLLTSIAENQQQSLEILAETGACRSLGPVGELDDNALTAALVELLGAPGELRRMSRAALALGVSESTSIVVDELVS